MFKSGVAKGVKPGLWRHFKGALYVVEGTALNVSQGPDEGLTMVLYWSLSDGPSKKFVRDLEEFIEPIRWRDGVVRPRFLFEEIK
jgi:hypothetical protein